MVKFGKLEEVSKVHTKTNAPNLIIFNIRKPNMLTLMLTLMLTCSFTFLSSKYDCFPFLKKI